MREEHIALLRQKAETDKKLSAIKGVVEQNNKAQAELQESVEQANSKVVEFEKELERLKEIEEKQAMVENENSDLHVKIKEFEVFKSRSFPEKKNLTCRMCSRIYCHAKSKKLGIWKPKLPT